MILLEFEKKNNNVKNNSVEFHDSKILTLIVLFYEGRHSTVNNEKRNLRIEPLLREPNNPC